MLILTDSNIGKSCPYCQFPIKDNAKIVVCSVCKTPHHEECWLDNKGCTTYGCTGKLLRSDRLFKGSFTWPTGARYTGEILGSLRHGYGLMIYPNGSKFEGVFVNDKRNGFGTMTYPDGRQLKGQWKDNSFEK